MTSPVSQALKSGLQRCPSRTKPQLGSVKSGSALRATEGLSILALVFRSIPAYYAVTYLASSPHALPTAGHTMEAFVPIEFFGIAHNRDIAIIHDTERQGRSPVTASPPISFASVDFDEEMSVLTSSGLRCVASLFDTTC